VKRLVGRSGRRPAGPADLDAALAGRERVFRAPPLTPDLIEAIRRISPHLDPRPDETGRQLWEADQNGACWGEHDALAPVLAARPAPARVLEIGPGLGRSLVFFQKRMGWAGAEWHAFDADGDRTRYTVLGPRGDDSYCGSLDALREVLAFNDVGPVTLHDAGAIRLADLPGPFDLIYSFYGIGFHWSLEHFLSDIEPLMHAGTLAVFTVPPVFRPFPALDRFTHDVVRYPTVWPPGGSQALLLVSRPA